MHTYTHLQAKHTHKYFFLTYYNYEQGETVLWLFEHFNSDDCFNGNSFHQLYDEDFRRTRVSSYYNDNNDNINNNENNNNNNNNDNNNNNNDNNNNNNNSNNGINNNYY